MRPVPAVCVAFVLLAVLGSCSALQESLSCPGESCPSELREVADRVAELPQVTSVDRTWRFANVDHGPTGGADVHASVATARDARRVAAAIADLYRASDVEVVDQVHVVVVPDPERVRADEAEATLVGDASDVAAVACADDRCAREVARFEDAFAAAAVADGATLGSVAWTNDDGDPATRIEVTAPVATWDRARLRAFESEIQQVAESAGLVDIGDVRTVVHYRRRVEFSFMF